MAVSDPTYMEVGAGGGEGGGQLKACAVCIQNNVVLTKCCAVNTDCCVLDPLKIVFSVFLNGSKYTHAASKDSCTDS